METAKTTNLSIRMDAKLKEDAEALFAELGMNMTTAFNIFVRQSLRVQGLPFPVMRPTPETLAAMREAKRIARDPNAATFRSARELVEALEK